jgi:hypothetical protein
MGLFDKLREPIVLKEESDAKKQLEQLNLLLPQVKGDIKSQIEQDIKYLQYGIYGEEALMFELKNSHMPMYILHDLFFERNGLKTQIDYLVITRKLGIILECKNLFGDIKIDNQGNFTRKVQMGKRYIQKGIYSPVTQNRRHLDMIREMCRENVPLLRRASFDRCFYDNYKSLIVLANPSSIIDMRFAPKEIREKVVKVDGLISYIRVLHNVSTVPSMSDAEMEYRANFFLENSVTNKKDYTEKYRQAISDSQSVQDSEEAVTEQKIEVQPEAAPAVQVANIEATPIYQALKKYRLDKSRKEKIKPYFLYNNSQLEEIIRISPKTIEELKKVNGFGDVKCAKYGEDIIKIISENQK